MGEESKAEQYVAKEVTTDEAKRVRAWVLVQAGDPNKFAKALANEFRDEERDYEFGEGGKDLVVVRADVVEGESDWNVVVPVDAKSEGILEVFVEKIKNYKGVTAVSVLKVSDGGHNPDPPHGSPTYVSWQELINDPVVDYFPGGRHPNSPGRNPWG